jgi:predicted membrane channel-forming protein YqfA (hemolysin III family)
MKAKDYLFIAYLLMGIGTVLFIAGLTAFFIEKPIYDARSGEVWRVEYPYMMTGLSILFFGMILFVIGVVFHWRAEEEKKESTRTSCLKSLT